ncbi:hypothetical protein TNIN_321981, partial [Trichonephila inaurata madagascariensis]
SVAVGEPEVPPGLEEDAPLLVVLDKSPLVVAEELLDGDAILTTQGLQPCHAVCPFAFREGIVAQHHLSCTPVRKKTIAIAAKKFEKVSSDYVLKLLLGILFQNRK